MTERQRGFSEVEQPRDPYLERIELTTNRRLDWARPEAQAELRVALGAGWRAVASRWRFPDLPGPLDKFRLRLQPPDEDRVGAVAFKNSRWNPAYIAARSTKRPGWWQLTWFDDAGPAGDTERETLGEAIEYARQDARLSEIHGR